MTTVNVPTNIKQKEADVNQKLQLYGIYEAFSNGKVPSNKQIDVALNSAIASKGLAKPSPKLSSEGQALLGDVRDVVEQAKVLLLTKNDGNLLQDFIWQTQQLSGGNVQKPGAPVDKATAKQHGNEALEGLRTLGTLLISNGQFRKLLSDATVLLRDIAGDAAQNAANRVNPSEEQLSQIDRPAEDNTWHDVPKIGDLKAQARSQLDKNKPFGKKQAQDAAANVADSDNQDQAQDGARQQMSNLGDQASANIPDETKDKVNEGKDKAKNYGSRAKSYASSKLPQERRDQSIYRLKKMVVEIQAHQDYQQAIETLLSLAEQYGGHGRNLSQQGAGSVKGAHEDTALTAAEADLRTLLERFANSTSSDDLFEAINNVYRDADKDPELKGWFKSIDKYVRKCLQEPGFIMQDAANDEWNQLYDQGHFLLRERYRNHTNKVFDEVKFIGNQFDEDPANKKFAASLQKLFNDLGNDENGKPTFKPHLLKDLSQVIIPGIFENIRYVPIPRIEYSDPMIDTIIENLVLEGDNLAPNSFEFGSDNYFKWGRRTITSTNKNKVMVSVSGIQCDLRDVSYYIHKKQGFPSIKDLGVMDIFMGGSGFSFKLAMETADKSDKRHFFKINNVTVDIKSLTIKLKQSKHKLLFNIFRPLMFAILRPAVGKALEKVIKDQVHDLDAKAYSIHQDAQRAVNAAKSDPANAPNIYKRYADAFQRQMAQGKAQSQQKAEATAADKKVNVAMTNQDSIFAKIKLPGGISSKATEYKELAAKGEKWESPIFGIGSASETSGLAKVAPISRKSHSTTTQGVRGPQNVENTQSGFTNQVDQAFGADDGQDYSLKNKTGGADGSLTNGNAVRDDSGRTTLGSSNPVLTGNA